jgi:PAS domain S-box-containing protein
MPHGGEMAAEIAGFDWSRNVLGPIESWPQSRRTAIDIMLNAPLPACIRWGRDGVILYNDAYAALAGDHHPALLGSTLALGWPEIADFTSKVMEQGLQGKPLSLSGHHLVVYRHGVAEDVWADLNYIPLIDEAGQPAGVLGFVAEVTGRVLAEKKRHETQSLLESVNERLDLALNAGPVLGTWVWDMSDDVLRADDRFARSFGLDPKRIQAGVKFLEILQTVHPDDQARMIKAGKATMRDGVRFQAEYRALHTDGDYRWVEASGRCDYDANGRPLRFPGILIDINERKQAELALRESEARFRTMADSAPALIWATDAEGRFTFANRRYETEFGLNLDDLSCGGWRRLIHQDDAKDALARFYAAVAARVPVGGELRMRNKLGDLRWMRCDGVPRFDETGNFLGYIGCNVDMTELYLAADLLEAKVIERTQAYLAITEQLQAEMHARERAEHALRQAHKMEAVGQLTGGLAHDFNNLLTGIIGNLELMQNRAAKSGNTEFDSYMEGARSAARRATALTHRLLAFSRRQTLEPRQLRLEEMMEDVEELIRRTVGPSISVQVQHALELWPTHCDQNQLENALLNLAINARDAMPEGGSLTIETDNIVLDKTFAAEQGDVSAGDYVIISVRDTGTGMAEDIVSRAFDPFFTTKPSGQGTGLGLSMIYGFVKQSGGHIRITSEAGQGTMVRMYLPRCLDEAPKPETPAVPPEVPCGHGERIMIVDDESSVRLSVSEMLGDLGYDVVAAEDGPSALALLEEAAPVDLLIADIGLPGMSGQQLAEAARLQWPGLKVLFITGYAENGASTIFSPEAGMEVVTKPFTMSVLAGKIHVMVSADKP